MTRIHACDVCRSTGTWTDNWQWFGSYRDLENRGENAIVKLCSDSCRGLFDAAGQDAVKARGLRDLKRGDR